MEFNKLKREDLRDAFGKDEVEMEEALWMIIQRAIDSKVTDLRSVRLPTTLAGIGSPASIGMLRLIGCSVRYLTVDRTAPKAPIVPTDQLVNVVAGLFKRPVKFSGGGPLNGQTMQLPSCAKSVTVECVGLSRSPWYVLSGDNAFLRD